MKKKTLYESQKNYLVCAILMIIVGLLMFPTGKTNWGIGCLVVGALFVIGFFVLLKKEGLREVDVDEPEVSKTEKATEPESVKADAEKIETSVEQDNTEK